MSKKFLLFILFTVSLNCFAQDLCTLLDGRWHGWVKIKISKLKARGMMKHLADNEYYAEGEVPELGAHGNTIITCENSIVHAKKLKKPLYLQLSGDTLVADYHQDHKKLHLEHSVNRGGLKFLNGFLKHIWSSR